jgi:hypothetical protein
LHGGGINILELSEITRHFKNILLDLSFTICEFSGSSLEMDIKYVMSRCFDRVCIGSDSPEFSFSELRNRFNLLTKELDIRKIEKIAYLNLMTYLSIKN